MAKNKMIKKNCPFCGIQVAVACKTCPGCKHSFYTTKKNTELISNHTVASTSSRRRTERVKREKPNYYDASEYEKKTSVKKVKRIERGQNHGRERGRPPNTQSLKKKKKKAKKEPKEVEDDLISILSPDKLSQCKIILAELNRKFITTTWRV